MADIQEIVEYYGNLLVIQYNNKPKARAMIEAIVKEMMADGILFDVRDGYSVDTAVGAQLDVIAKYVGVDRFFTRQTLTGYFSYTEYDELVIDPDKEGFSEYSDFDTLDGKWLTYEDVISTTNKLTDEEFRTIIKLKIVQNNSNHSHKSIDDSMYAFFGDSVIPFSTGNMEMTYLISGELTPILEVAIQKEVLPRPMGVGLIIINQSPGVFLVDGQGSFANNVVHTRLSSATYFNAILEMQTAGVDVARFTYG